MGVCYLAKIRILKQITTWDPLLMILFGCLLSCKDTNFKANHNLGSPSNDTLRVFVILQRYEF